MLLRVMIFDAQARPVNPDLVLVWTLEVLINLLKRKETELRKQAQINRERERAESAELQQRAARAEQQLKAHERLLEDIMRQEIPMTPR